MKNMYSALCLLALLVACQTPPNVQLPTPSASSTPTPQPTPCEAPCLNGSLVDYLNIPVANVRITLSTLDQSPQVIKSVVSNAQGAYFIAQVPKDTPVTMTLEKSGFFTHTRIVSLNDINSANALGKQINITLKAQNEPGTCLIACTDTNTLTGKVVTTDNTLDLKTAKLTLKSQEDIVPYEATVDLNPDGTYQFEGAPANIRMTLLLNSESYEPIAQNTVLKEKRFGKESLDITLVPKK